MEKKTKSPKKETASKAPVVKAVKKEKESLFDKNKSYSIAEAIELVKKTNQVKFDASIEVHFRLGIDPKKGDQQIRTAVSLPNGTGKTVKIAAFVTPANEKTAREAGADFVGGEELIAEIKKTEKTDFEVAIAEPELMKNMAQIAKILGTRGLMPSPKNETVTTNPVKAIGELKKGKVSFKNDDTGNIHTVIGKISFDSQKLVENFSVLLEAIKKTKPASSKGVFIKNAVICSSMGSSIKLSL